MMLNVEYAVCASNALYYPLLTAGSLAPGTSILTNTSSIEVGGSAVSAASAIPPSCAADSGNIATNIHYIILYALIDSKRGERIYMVKPAGF